MTPSLNPPVLQTPESYYRYGFSGCGQNGTGGSRSSDCPLLVPYVGQSASVASAIMSFIAPNPSGYAAALSANPTGDANLATIIQFLPYLLGNNSAAGSGPRVQGVPTALIAAVTGMLAGSSPGSVDNTAYQRLLGLVLGTSTVPTSGFVSESAFSGTGSLFYHFDNCTLLGGYQSVLQALVPSGHTSCASLVPTATATTSDLDALLYSGYRQSSTANTPRNVEQAFDFRDTTLSAAGASAKLGLTVYFNGTFASPRRIPLSLNRVVNAWISSTLGSGYGAMLLWQEDMTSVGHNLSIDIVRALPLAVLCSPLVPPSFSGC